MKNARSITFSLFITLSNLSGCGQAGEERAMATMEAPKLENPAAASESDNTTESDETSLVRKVYNFGKPVLYPNKSVELDEVRNFAVDGDYVFTGNRSGSIRAFDINSGNSLWTTTLETSIICQMEVDKNRIYVCDRLNVYSINKVSGEIRHKWPVPTSEELNSLNWDKLTVRDNYVVFHDGTGFVSVYEKESGDLVWSGDTNSYDGSISFSNELLIASPRSESPILFAISYENLNGEVDLADMVWTYSDSECSPYLEYSVAVVNEKVFVWYGCNQKVVVSMLSKDDGSAVWRQETAAAGSFFSSEKYVGFIRKGEIVYFDIVTGESVNELMDKAIAITGQDDYGDDLTSWFEMSQTIVDEKLYLLSDVLPEIEGMDIRRTNRNGLIEVDLNKGSVEYIYVLPRDAWAIRAMKPTLGAFVALHDTIGVEDIQDLVFYGRLESLDYGSSRKILESMGLLSNHESLTHLIYLDQRDLVEVYLDNYSISGFEESMLKNVWQAAIDAGVFYKSDSIAMTLEAMVGNLIDTNSNGYKYLRFYVSNMEAESERYKAFQRIVDESAGPILNQLAKYIIINNKIPTKDDLHLSNPDERVFRSVVWDGATAVSMTTEEYFSLSLNLIPKVTNNGDVVFNCSSDDTPYLVPYSCFEK